MIHTLFAPAAQPRRVVSVLYSADPTPIRKLVSGWLLLIRIAWWWSCQIWLVV